MKTKQFSLLSIALFVLFLVGCKNDKKASIEEINVGDGNFKFPQVILSNHTTSEAINNYLAYSISEGGVNSLNIKSKIEKRQREISSGDFHGWTSLGYKVSYNDDYVLSMIITSSYMGNYQTEDYQFINFDLKSGYRFGLDQIVNPSKEIELRQLIAADIKNRLLRSKEKIPKEDWNESMSNYWEEAFNKVLLFENGIENEVNMNKFTITKSGISFSICSVDLPHVVQCYEPPKDYDYSWGTLKPYLLEHSPISSILDSQSE